MRAVPERGGGGLLALVFGVDGVGGFLERLGGGRLLGPEDLETLKVGLRTSGGTHLRLVIDRWLSQSWSEFLERVPGSFPGLLQDCECIGA